MSESNYDAIFDVYDIPKEVRPKLVGIAKELTEIHVNMPKVQEQCNEQLKPSDLEGMYKSFVYVMVDRLASQAASGPVDTSKILNTPAKELYKTLMPE